MSAPVLNPNVLQYQEDLYWLWGGAYLQFTSLTASGVLGNAPVVLCDATAGAITVTLPSAAAAKGRQYMIKKIDSSANNVTLAGTIDGVLNDVLVSRYAVAWIFSDGLNWYRLNTPTLVVT